MPSVDWYFPQRSPETGGIVVTIAGPDLGGTTGVQFGGGAAPFGTNLTVTENRITVTTPAVAASSPPTYLRPSNLVVSPAFVFGTPVQSTYTSVGPLFISPAGDTVTIVGTQLMWTSQVRLGSSSGPSCDVIAATQTQLTVRTPPHQPGLVGVWVQAQTGVWTRAGQVFIANCRRLAWLTLPGSNVNTYLEDLGGAWVCPNLDISGPDIRDVVNNRPDRDGTDDRTSLMGARTVTATIVAGQGGTRTVDEIARLFGPYLVPSRRPELHYMLDTPDDNYAERIIGLRATDWSAPIAGPWLREINLAWVAPNPVIWSATERTADLTSTSYNWWSPGELDVYPRIRLWGPGSAWYIRFRSMPDDWLTMFFTAGYTIAAGAYVDVDSDARTVINSAGQHIENQVSWGTTQGWPFGRGGNIENRTQVWWSGGDANTRARMYWRDGYLTP